MTSNVYIKDPQALLDFGFDWSQWLNDTEIITGYTITTGCGITKVFDTYTTTGSVVVWLSGGTAGERYTIACLIETSGSRVDERSIKLDIRQR